MLKKQKKLIKDDLNKASPSHSKLEDAYANILKNKSMAVSAVGRAQYNQLTPAYESVPAEKKM